MRTSILLSSSLALACALTTSVQTRAQESRPAGEKHIEQSPLSEMFGLNSSCAADTGCTTEADTSIRYQISPKFGAEFGVPLYFVSPNGALKKDAANAGASAQQTLSYYTFGDTFLRAGWRHNRGEFRSGLTGTLTIPTGDTTAGVSSGRVTGDMTEHVERDLGDRFSPYAEIGFGNNVLHAHLASRQYSSLGALSHFKAGSDLTVSKRLDLDTAAYYVLPFGDQKLYSFFVQRAHGGTVPNSGKGKGRGKHGVFTEVPVEVGNSDLTRDYGVDSSLSYSLSPRSSFDLGYTHSVYHEDSSVYFGFTVRVGGIAHEARRQ